MEYRSQLRVGDLVKIPFGKYGHKEDGKEYYTEICPIVAKHKWHCVVSHGLWQESVMYIDLITGSQGIALQMATRNQIADYWTLKSRKRELHEMVYAGAKNLEGEYKAVCKKVKDLEPYVRCALRMMGTEPIRSITNLPVLEGGVLNALLR